MKDWPGESVNCCISSPPYWALRDYGVKGQLGLEPTFEEYIEKLCTIYDEVKRVLRADGTCWVNLGDTYNAGRSGGWAGGKHGISKPENAPNQSGVNARNLPTKSLCLIPQRFEIEMVNRGWLLRNVLIWHKPNPMPSSAKDRFTVDFEYVYFFVKSSDSVYWVHTRKMLSVSERPKPDYRWQHASGYELRRPPDEPNWKEKRVKCSDCKGTGKVRPVLNTAFFQGMVGAPEICGRCLPSLEDPDVKNYTVPEWNRVNLWEGRDYWFEPQYEPYLTESNAERPRMGQGNQTKYMQKRAQHMGGAGSSWQGHSGTLKADGTQIQSNPLGRNKRCVWTIPTQAYSEAHFATFPEKLVEPMIKAGCPEFVCTKCGKAREKVWERVKGHDWNAHKTEKDKMIMGCGTGAAADYERIHTPPKFKGYTDCGCGADWRAGVMLDPFAVRARLVRLLPN